MNSLHLAPRILRLSNSVRHQLPIRCISKSISTTPIFAEGEPPSETRTATSPAQGITKPTSTSAQDGQRQSRANVTNKPPAPSSSERSDALGRLFTPIADSTRDALDDRVDERYYLHIYSTKHNTHITMCSPKHEPLPKLSLSAGNMGFKKANRGTYDAAYQLMTYILRRIKEQGLLSDIKNIEVILRGFGVGREAATKVLLGTEGSIIRDKIKAVSDGTRTKFGGTRGKKPRRLG